MELLEQRQDFIACSAVQRTGGFVRKEKHWLIGKSPRNSNALLFTSRKLRRPMADAVIEADPIQSLLRSAAPHRLANSSIG